MKKRMKSHLINISTIPFVSYTVLFIGLAILIFGYFVLAKQSFIWTGDGYSQHYLIFSDYLNKLRSFFSGEGFPMWDWTIGLGSDTILSYGYYVIGDPFVYLGLLFPSGQTELAYHVLILLRVYFVGISFLVFAKWKNFTKLTMVLTSLIYAFSHFVLHNVLKHPFFILPMIFFPLIIFGFEKLVTEDKAKYFVFIIFLSAVSNFYFFYKMSLLLFIYAVIRFLSFPKEERTVKQFLSLTGKSLQSYIIGISLASVLFIPVVIGFLTSSRSPGGVDINLWFYPLNYYGALLVNFLTPGTYFWLVGGLPVVSLIVIPFLWKQRRIHFIWITNLLFLGFMTLIPWFASIMNGFSGPYNRFSFAIPFYLTIGIAITLDSVREIKKDSVKISFMFLIFFSLVHIFAAFLQERYLYYILPIILAWGIYILFRQHVGGAFLSKTVKFRSLLYSLILMNIVVTAWSYYLPYGKDMTKSVLSYGEVEKSYQETFDGLERQLPQNDEFYRIGVTSKDNFIKNQMIYLNQKGLNSYLSLTNQSISEFAYSLKLKDFQIIQPLRNGLDDRPIANYFLGVEYIFAKKENSMYIPDGYNIVSESKNREWVVAETNYNFPFAYASAELISEKKFDQLNPVEKEYYLLKGNVSEDDPVNSGVKPEKIYPFQISLQNESEGDLLTKEKLVNFDIQDEATQFQLVSEFDAKELIGKQVYLSFDGLNYEPFNWSPFIRQSKGYRLKVSMGSRNESVYQSDVYSFSSYFKRDNMLFNLGTVENEDQLNSIRVQFDETGNYSIENLSLYAADFSQQEIKKAVKNKNDRSLNNLRFSRNTVEGDIYSLNEELLITTIPYSRGWTAKINGEKVDTIKINKGFVGIPLQQGENQLTLAYRTPGLLLGLAITSGTLVFLLSFKLISKRKKETDF
ncbi:YfhO family protein [Lacticigenium naphthae]|uniref:YfhO family protein n=1 Tax=Lacticigenium naphthae TaxID=515351 RepID=UPI0003FCDE91|nr:YfhO family protein [Lacticigenium naphthae]